MIKNKTKAILCAIATIALMNTPTTTIEASAASNQKTVAQKSSTTKMQVINIDSLNVRKGANAKSTKLGSVKKGQTLEVISISNGWAKINFKGNTGYVSSKYLKEVKDTKTSSSKYKKREMSVTSTTLTVRKSNSTKSSSLGKLKKGNVVIAVQESSNGWVKIEYKGKFGYVQNSNLKKGSYVEDRESANKAVSKIKSLNSKITLKDKSNVTKARSAYNSLNKNAKKLVTNLNVLEKAEAKIAQLEADQKSANSVIAKINSLNSNITLNDKNTVIETRNEYNKLNSSAKKLVTNLDILENAEAKIAELEAILEAELNQTNARKVMTQIDELNKTITLNDSNLIKNTRQAYEELNNDSKLLVTNLDILENAEAKIAILEAEQKRAELNQTNARKVMTQIDELNKTITLNDSNLIKNTRQAYEELNNDSKLLVTNLDILESAENALYEIRLAVRHAIKLMDELPIDIKLEHKPQVEEARRAFNSLSKEAQNSIPDLQLAILRTAELKIEDIERENAHKLIAKDLVERIEKLNKTIEYTDAEEIKYIRNAYDSLIYPVKQDVTNYNDFIIAERKKNDVYCLLIATEHLIKELPSEITLEHKDVVEEAYRKYNDLSQNNKLGIDNNLVAKLDNAVATLEQLQNLS